jgi:predicted lipid-binding transport protein (Tim44 family)
LRPSKLRNELTEKQDEHLTRNRGREIVGRLRMKKSDPDLQKSDPGPNPKEDDGGGGAFGATVGAIGGGLIGGIEGGLFGAGIGVVAGGLAGYFVGSAYGRWRLRHKDDD